MTGDSSKFYGTSNVNNGTVFMNGALGGNTNVYSGAFLGGTGTIGNVHVYDGATLLGNSGDVFTIKGDLLLDQDATIAVGLGQPSSVGLFNVTGDIVLDGTITVTDQGGFAPGLYRIIDYAGILTDNGLEIGLLPTGADPASISLQLEPNQVNLVNSSNVRLNFWDGFANGANGVVDGGSGTWDNASSLWTQSDGTINAPWSSEFAIFQGNAGTVSVDGTQAAVRAQGMQFAVDGYNIIGDSIELTEAEALIRVGDGTGAENVTANIASELTGSAKLVKTDRGTLILDAANTYTGGTVIRSGVLQVSADNNLGHADGDVTMEGSRLRNTRAFTTARDFTMSTGGGVFETQADLTVSGLISGPESLTKTGADSLIMTSDNTYGEGTLIEQGTIQLGVGGTSGWIQGDVSSYGTLVFNRSDAKSFDGVMSGNGRIIQQGTGTTTLSADSSALLGASEIQNGTLVVNGKLGGTLAVNNGRLHGIGTVGSTTLEATGVIAPGNSIGHLTINGDFVGKGGLIEIETALGGDNSPTDLLTITGATSGNATVQVSNVGGLGAQTVEGIKIIEVGGASNGLFTLKGDYVFQGDQAVVAGAYAYRLMQGGVSTAKDDDWYLRSTLTTPVTPTDPTDPTDPTEPTEPTEPSKPEPPLYQPGVPLYEVYPQALLGLNRLGTLQQRVGNRSWQDSHGDYGLGDTEGKGIWTRIDAGHRKVEPRSSTTDSTFKQDYYRLQVGMDNLVSQNERGALVAGASVDIVSGKTNVSSQYGNGRIKTDGFGLGGNVTWYADDGVYVDGQAKINWYRSDLTSRLVEGRLTDRNHATGYGLSLEAGKRIGVGENWTLTPQAQLVYSSISLDSFTDTFDARVSLNRANSALGRVGLAASRDKITTADDGQLTRSHFYGIANINYEFAGAPRMNVSGTRLQNREGRSSAELGLGGTYSWANDTYSIYGEGSAASNFHKFGNSYDLKGQIGFRVRW